MSKLIVHPELSNSIFQEPIAQESLHSFLDTLLNAQDEATLRQGADELRSFVQSFEYPEDALRFGSRLMKVAKHTPDLPQKHDAAFLWELMQLGGAYATLDPLHPATPGEEPLKFFLDTLWRARDYGSIEQGIGEFATFLNGVDEPTKLLKLEQRLIEAAKQAPTLDASVNDVKFLSALIGLARPYAALNPSPIANADETAPIAFLNTLWWAENQAEVETGIGQFAAFVQNIDDSTHLLQFEQNLLTAVQQSSAADLQTQGHRGEFLSNLMDLGRTYAFINPILDSNDQPSESFLNTLWRAESKEEIEKGASEFSQFIEGYPTATAVDSTQLLEFTNNLITVANQASIDLGQTQDAAFFAALIGVGRNYLSLKPQVSSDEDQPLNFYLDTLLKDLQNRANLQAQVASPQLLQQTKQEAIAQATAEFGEVIYGLADSKQRAAVLGFGQNLLEVAARTPQLQPQEDNPQFLSELLKFAKLYGSLQFIESLPVDAPASFLHPLWQTDAVPDTSLQQAQAFFGELGTAIAITDTPLFALRLLLANEQRAVVAEASSANTSPDLTLQLAQLAKAYAALKPEKGYGNPVSPGSHPDPAAFLDTLWSTTNDADAIGNLAEIRDGALELNKFLVGDEISKGFAPADQPQVLEFTTKLLKAAEMSDQLAENQRTNPALLQSAFIDVARNFAHIQLRDTQPNPGQTLFLYTLWNAAVDDTAAIRQGVDELETLLGEYGVSIESMESMGKILLAIDLAIDKLGEEYPEAVQEMLRNVLILMGIGVAIAAVIDAPFVAGVAGFVALVGAMFDAFTVGFAGTETLQHLMEFYTQAISATDDTEIDQAATAFIDVLKSGTEFVAAVISLLTIGQSGWAEMEDALQSLMGLFRSIGSNLARFLSFLKVFGRIGDVRAFITALSAGRWQHLTDLAEYIDSKNNALNALLDTLLDAHKAVEGLIAAETPEAERLIDFLLDRMDDFGASNVKSLLNHLDIRSIERIFEADGLSGLEKFNATVKLVDQKKITGFENWIEYNLTGLQGIRQNADYVRDTLYELVEAQRMIQLEPASSSVNVGNDITSGRNLDNLLEKDGIIRRRVEVKHLVDPVEIYYNFSKPISDAADKARSLLSSAPGSREVSIYSDFRTTDKVQGGITIRYYPNGIYEKLRGSSTGLIPFDTGNIFNEIANNLNSNSTVADGLTHINVYSKADNETLAILERDSLGIWSVVVQRP